MQEWKNILLRGDDPELLAKHHKAFTKQDTDTGARLASVAQQADALGFADDARKAVALAAAHEALTQSYESTLENMLGGARSLDGAAARAIDMKLRGADRALEASIGTLAAEIGAASDAKRDALIKTMGERYAVLYGFIVSVILGALVVMGFVVYRLLRATRA